MYDFLLVHMISKMNGSLIHNKHVNASSQHFDVCIFPTYLKRLKALNNLSLDSQTLSYVSARFEKHVCLR
jgi:hypothetical protein